VKDILLLCPTALEGAWWMLQAFGEVSTCNLFGSSQLSTYSRSRTQSVFLRLHFLQIVLSSVRSSPYGRSHQASKSIAASISLVELNPALVVSAALMVALDELGILPGAQAGSLEISARLVVMNSTNEATPRRQGCDNCCSCFFEARVVRDVERDIHLEYIVFGKRPIAWLSCVARTGASVKSEADKPMLLSTFNKLNCI
jgi:hypothetical protein